MGKESRKRTWNIIERVFFIVLTILAIIAFVCSFFVNDEEHYALLALSLNFLMFLPVIYGGSLLNKVIDNRIDGKSYPDVNGLAYGVIWGVALSYLTFIYELIIIYIVDRDKCEPLQLTWNIPLFIFSLLSFFSLVFKWKNAIFLVRSWLLTLIIGFIYLMGLRISKCYFQTWSALWEFAQSAVFLCIIIALCARGFIITFGENAKKVFPKEDRKTEWYDIFLVLLLVCAIILCYRTNWESVLFNN